MKKVFFQLWGVGLLVWGVVLFLDSRPATASAFELESAAVAFRGSAVAGSVLVRLEDAANPQWERGVRGEAVPSNRSDEGVEWRSDLVNPYLARRSPRYFLEEDFGLVELGYLLPLGRELMSARRGVDVEVRPTAANRAAFVTTAGAWVGERPGQPLRISAPAGEVLHGLALSGAFETLPCPNTGLVTHVAGTGTARAAEAWLEVLAHAAEVSGGLDLSGLRLFLLRQPPDRERIPVYVHAGTLVAGWTPASALSTEAALRSLLEAGFAESHPRAPAWFRGALATRLAMEALGRAGRLELGERWERVSSEYAFLHPSRERALDEFEGASARTRHYLARLKGLLLLRFLEQLGPARRPAGPLAPWLDLLDHVEGGADLRELVARAFGAEAEELYAASVPARCFFPGAFQGAVTELAARRGGGAGAPRTPDPEAQRRFVLAVTANTENFLETCGCKAGQYGGLSRRVALMQERAPRDELIGLDLGDFSPRLDPQEFGAQDRRAVEFHVRAMAAAGYEGIAAGANELYRGPRYLERIASVAGDRFLSSNYVAADATAGAPAPFRRFRRGGTDFLLVAATPLHPLWIDGVEVQRRHPEMRVERPLQGLRRLAEIQAEIREPRGDTVVLLHGHLPSWWIPELLAEYPGIDVIVSGDRRLPTRDEHAHRPQAPPGFNGSRAGFVGDTLVVLCNQGSSGMSFVDLTLGPHGRVSGFELDNVLLTQDLPADPELEAALDELYAADDGGPDLAPHFGEEPLERALLAGDARNGYAGAESCRSCHAEAYANWKRTPHASAFETLVLKHRQRRSACAQCHVVGMGLPTGYDPALPEQAARLKGVQCEVCHGPGRAHVEEPAAPSGRLRATVAVEACEQCHTSEHSEPLRTRLDEAWAIGAHRPSQEEPEEAP